MYQRTWIVGAVAAMLAVATQAAWAQDTTAPTLTPLNNVTMPTITPIPMPPQIDYTVLENQPFTYIDLEAAERSGLSDGAIASIAKIAMETRYPFHVIRDQVLQGQAIPTLCLMYGLSLPDILDTAQEQQTIQDYKAAYRTTGYYALRNMDNGRMSSDMGMSSMPAAAPMAPAASNMGMAAPMSNTAMTPTSDAQGTVVAVAMDDPRLTTLVRAIQAAGLASTLEGPGPFTVFAPDNAAFRQLGRGQIRTLMSDPASLRNILEYHVISGQKIDAAAAMSMTSPTSPPTVEGGTLNVTTSNGKVMVNDATVVQPDLEASNGIIHVIDRVLMPQAGSSAAGMTPAAMAPTTPQSTTPPAAPGATGPAAAPETGTSTGQ